MHKLVSQLLWYDRVCVTTANASALEQLAELLDQGKYGEFRRLICRLDGRLRLVDGDPAKVSDDLTVELPERLYPGLARRLKALAQEKASACFHLSEIEPQLAKHSPHDWRIQLVEFEAEPVPDYSPDPDGTEWEAVLFHQTTDPIILESAWKEIVRWSAPSDRYDPQKLNVHFNGPNPVSETHKPREAFKVFFQGRAPICGSDTTQIPYRVQGYRHLPFKITYGEALDWLQVWFEEDRIVLIAADRHAETGRSLWDMENYFIYRTLVKALSRVIAADRLAWSICAEMTAQTLAFTPDRLDDLEFLWTNFEALANAKRNPDRETFEAMFTAGQETA